MLSVIAHCFDDFAPIIGLQNAHVVFPFYVSRHAQRLNEPAIVWYRSPHNYPHFFQTLLTWKQSPN